MAIEIVDFPMKNMVIFQFAMLVITRGYVALKGTDVYKNGGISSMIDSPCWNGGKHAGSPGKSIGL